MTVKELIEILKNEDQDRIIVLAKDSEGNGYSSYISMNTCKYDISEQETGMECLDDEDIENGYDEEDVMEGGVKALVLYP